MDQTTPLLLVPGLASSARIYAPVIPALWRFGPVMVANHIRDDSMAAIARRVLSEARRALRSPAIPWAATSRWRSCARRPSGS